MTPIQTALTAVAAVTIYLSIIGILISDAIHSLKMWEKRHHRHLD